MDSKYNQEEHYHAKKSPLVVRPWNQKHPPPGRRCVQVVVVVGKRDSEGAFPLGGTFIWTKSNKHNHPCQESLLVPTQHHQSTTTLCYSCSCWLILWPCWNISPPPAGWCVISDGVLPLIRDLHTRVIPLISLVESPMGHILCRYGNTTTYTNRHPLLLLLLL